MEMTDETVTCSSHHIYPVPQVTWATDPPSAQEALENSTLKTTDHRGLFTVASTLRILGHLSNCTYFCSFISADKTQVWTASRKNQDSITQTEGHALSVPCITPHILQNFSLTWTFTLSSEPTVILRYDTKTRHTFNLWEGQAEVDQDLLLLGNGSLLLHKPDIEEHSGMYTCTFSGLQNKHIVQTKVNITVSPISVDEQSVQRSWWSTAASAAFFLFTVIIAVPQCVRQRAKETSHRYNGVGFVEGGPHKELNTSATYVIRQHGVECNRLQPEAKDEVAASAANTAEDCEVALPPGAEIEEEKPVGPPVEDDDELQSSCLEEDGS
ncbi:uncharacterized protein LOC143333143 [Chaetodon auriga]|uniref:uncharacterized protein LOC143333143 n=1 Tax=Chaetodon auriga TaxID=39042 RepID=UPI004033084A